MQVITAIVVVVLVGFSALFSAIETALFSLKPFQIERLRTRKPAFGVDLSRLMGNPRRLLSAILVCDVLVNLPLVVLCMYLLRGTVVAHVPFWAAALLIFTLIVIVCDLVPKLLALAQTERVARMGVRVMSGLMPLIDPLCRGLQHLSERVADGLIPTRIVTQQSLSGDELETLVELSVEQGAFNETESEMIQEIIKLGDKTAKDCMTPRVDAFAIRDDLSQEEVLTQIRVKRHRWVPVYGETPDDILGVLDVPGILLDPALHYTERLMPPSFVPETMKAIDLLRSFLKHPQGLAVVVDEHGGTEGVVTLNDLVEEIISDAVPKADHALYIEAVGEGELLVNGNARIDDINEELGVSLEEDGIDTIGGLIFNRFGGLPRTGTRLDIDGVTLTVRRISRKRIEEVFIRQHQVGEDTEEEGQP